MTYLILLIIAIVFGVLWFQARGRGDRAEAALQAALRQRDIAERKASEWHELLLQSYVAMQALAEKGLEAEWIRDGQIVQPGIWVGDQFIEVEAGEADDIEVGQPVGETEDPIYPSLPTAYPRRPYSWKNEMP